MSRRATSAAFGILSAWIGGPLGAQPPCPTSPVSLVEIGDPAAPHYIGITFKYSQGTSPLDLLRAGGITIGDFDDDGAGDILLPGGVNQAMLLARNLGNGTFANVASSVGLTNTAMRQSAALFCDYDHDGDLDIVVAAHAQGSSANLIKLFRNSGAAGGFTFHDVTAPAGFAFDTGTVEPTLTGQCGGLTAGDYDGDGFLDVFVTWWNAGLSSPQNDMWRLFRSQPNTNPATNDPTNPTHTPRSFVDRTVAAGLNVNLDLIPDVDGGPIGGEAWQPTFVDLDNDGWVDLHVCVDFGADFLFLNDQDGTFTDVATEIGLNGMPAQVRNEMGVSFADVDNDGDLDVHKTNIAAGTDGSPTDPKIWKDRFYRNDSSLGRLRFVDMGPVTGAINSEVGWGTIAVDLDNDADLDQAFVAGMRTLDDPFLNRIHLNLHPLQAGDGLSPQYCDATAFVPEYSCAPVGDCIARNIQALDFEGDGDLDLIVGYSTDTTSAVIGERFKFFRNTLAPGNDWIDLDLENLAGSKNTVNARVWLRAAGRTQHKQILAGTSFHGFEDPRLHFGLGAAGGPAIEWAVIRWPGEHGNHQYVTNLTANQVNSIARLAHDWLGDVNVDGKTDYEDAVLLLDAVVGADAHRPLDPDWPGFVLGDIDGDNALTLRDVAQLLTRHGFQKQ
jgi:hypothetical protein